MSPSNAFTFTKALALATALLPSVLGAETGHTQVAVTTDSLTFTAVESFGNVVLQDGSSTATINPGQHTQFNGISVSAVPERTAIVVDGSATYGFTHPVPDASETAPASPSPSEFGGAGLPYAIISASGDVSITVSPIPNSYILQVSTATTTIGAGRNVSFAGAQISALSNTGGVVANDFTFTLSEPSAVSSITTRSSSATPTRSSAATTLVSGTNTPSTLRSTSTTGAAAATTTAPSTSGSANSGSGSSQASSSPAITGNAAATFTTGDLSIVGWLASSIGMLMFAFGL
ncbi:hypothetical protein K431DRAFT_287802 [Polychaeton citri CBS 116435]|uniref:Uncharacterized protein n=1 Tax=Polychaeton citri CBS 116435 TaxID=1314669 RepID=A0A9P4Q2R8_9PEZI|nr:hypothetical protein K431DRAFT_287802 [Polychaeton citri CBS 116435]